MKRIALLADVHANLPALTSVLRDVRKSGADQLVFLGDLVGYGASPAECVQLVRKLGGISVMGNHDLHTVALAKRPIACLKAGWRKSGSLAGMVHAATCLSQEDLGWLSRLPMTLEIPGALVAHGSPNEPQQFHYVDSRKSAAPGLRWLEERNEGLAIVGHTHKPNLFAKSEGVIEWQGKWKARIPEGEPCIVALGSVGQPRTEKDLRACWGLWQPDERVLEFRRSDYDRVKAASDIAAAGLPAVSAVRLLTPEEIRQCM